MSNDLVQYSEWKMADIERAATIIAKSGLFGVKTPEQAAALMLLAQAEGLHPAIAARDYHIIDGRPSLKADAMLARFQAAGGSVEWLEYNDKKVTARFTHPQSGTFDVTWDIQRATAAGLANKRNWKMYPRQMLKARVISEGVRMAYPGVVVGVYTPEEMTDIVEGEYVEKPQVDNQQPSADSNGCTKQKTKHENHAVPEEEKTVAPPVQWLIDCGAAENTFSAAGILNKLELTGPDVDKETIVRMGLAYRGWRDAGKEADEAAELTLQGKKPTS